MKALALPSNSSQRLSMFRYCLCESSQFRVIPRTGNRFFKTVAVAECYLVITHIKNKESKKRTFQIYHAVNLADGRMSIKKEKKSSFLIYSILSFTKMAGKQNLFRKR